MIDTWLDSFLLIAISVASRRLAATPMADFGFIKLWGAPAWWLWGALHVGFLLGMRNRFATMMNWFWAYLSFGGGIRLITGADLQTGQAPLYRRHNGHNTGNYEQPFTHRSREQQTSDTGC